MNIILNLSSDFKKELNKDNRNYLEYVDITLKDKTEIKLTNKELWGNSLAIKDAVSSENSFDIGAAIINQCSFIINNIYDNYSIYDFSEANVVVYVGMELSNGTIEKIRKGTFIVDEAKYNGSLISITCLDYLSKFDKDYSISTLKYPATLLEIYLDACKNCGITYITARFDNDDYVVKERPDDSALTFRQVLQWICQISCKWARMDVYGRLALKWYEQAIFEQTGNSNGGTFKDQPDGKFENLLSDSGTSIYAPASKGVIRDFISKTLKPNTTYTLVSNAKVPNENAFIRVYDKTSSNILCDFSNGQNGAEKIVFTTPQSVSGNFLKFVVFGNSGSGTVSRWACLYEGNVDAPLYWVPAQGEEQYEMADCTDGGTFDFDTGDVVDAGTFEDQESIHHLHSFFSATVFTDDVVITGIRVKEFAIDSKKAGTYESGEKGYLLEISNNKFILPGNGQDVADYLGKKLIGLRFRPFSISALSNPSIEAGDCAYITDRKNNTYQTFITNSTFQVGNQQKLSCGAETPSRNSASRYSQITQAYVDNRNQTEQQLTEYDKIVNQITDAIDNSLGMFKTVKRTENGGVIVYQHNKPKLEDSDTIWKKTELGFEVSTDGGKTWNAGIDSSGNAFLNVLAVIGFYFDWAKGGTLTLGGSSNKNGILRVLDSSGGLVGKIDQSGSELNGKFVSKSANTWGVEYVSLTDAIISGGLDDTQWAFLDLVAQYADKRRHAAFSCENGTIHLQGIKISIEGDTEVYGSKSRIVETDNYETVAQYCYETPTPMFGDIGGGRINSDGIAIIDIDPIFENTVCAVANYHVFLQKEGEGDIWVSKKERDYFIVKGTPNLEFSWEIKAIQRNFESYRLNNVELYYLYQNAYLDYDNEIDEDINELVEESDAEIQGMLDNVIYKYDLEMEELINESN